jgi:hypothetical protein
LVYWALADLVCCWFVEKRGEWFEWGGRGL